MCRPDLGPAQCCDSVLDPDQPETEQPSTRVSAHPATLPPRLGSGRGRGRGHRAAARPPRGQGHECRVSGHTRAVTPRRATRSRELLVTRVTFLPYARYKPRPAEISLEIRPDTGHRLAPPWPEQFLNTRTRGNRENQKVVITFQDISIKCKTFD